MKEFTAISDWKMPIQTFYLFQKLSFAKAEQYLNRKSLALSQINCGFIRLQQVINPKLNTWSDC